MVGRVIFGAATDAIGVLAPRIGAHVHVRNPNGTMRPHDARRGGSEPNTQADAKGGARNAFAVMIGRRKALAEAAGLDEPVRAKRKRHQSSRVHRGLAPIGNRTGSSPDVYGASVEAVRRLL